MKRKIMYGITFLLSVFLVSCESEQEAKRSKDYAWKTVEANGFTYKIVENDPSNTRFYELENGLTVILSPSTKEPRIQTLIATKAGSKTDPASHTGLAHYLEHMLFKGTDKFGTLDWEKEKPILEKIESLYEVYNAETDEEKRKEIYREIDLLSGEAAKYAIANEYDRIMAGMGATGTNAFTSVEETVYLEDIPSNAVSKFLTVQAERFRNPVLRLFHTELEAVYEEKNRSIDSDGSKVFETLFSNLFQKHNYGLQTTIGTVEHLKNPSLVEIRKYYETYYVPNNMAIIMSGDFNPDEVIKEIDEAFGYMEAKPVPEYKFELEDEIQSPIKKEVFGPESAEIMMAYRFPGANSENAKLLNLVGDILTNGSAGVIDLNLVKKQRILDAYAFPYVMKDYGALFVGGAPTEGQTLEEVEALLVEQVEKLKKGEFSDDILTAIVNNSKRSNQQSNESYRSRAYKLLSSFILEQDWLASVKEIEWLESITKQDVIDFANKYFNDNYVVVYKRQGENKDVEKVEKPEITPVEINREAQSDFFKEVSAMPEHPIDPVWLDYEKDIDRASTGSYDVLAVENKDNNLFKLHYHFNIGKWDNRLLPMAVNYLEFLGTPTKSAEEISTEFYGLASTYYIDVRDKETIIYFSGLQENFNETVEKFDDLLRNCVVDEEAFKAYIARLKQARENNKENRAIIASGMQNYAIYGENNPFNNALTTEELEELKAEDLVEIIHDMAAYKHNILYYGPKSAKEIAEVMKEVHYTPDTFKEYANSKEYIKEQQTDNTVYLTYYDMVQAEIYWLRNGNKFDNAALPTILAFNNYFGSGMESIVFQTIRESMALAYSSYAQYRTANDLNAHKTFVAYVGTQNDKFDEAVGAMNNLLTELPRSDKAFENAKEGQRKKLATERVTGISIIHNYLNAQRYGRDYDVRKVIYEQLPSLTFEQVNDFYREEVSGKPYTYTIIAGEGKISDNQINALGKVRVLTLEEIFGY